MIKENKIESQPTSSISLAKDREEGGKILSEEEFLKNLFIESPEKGFDLLFRKYYSKLCSHSIRYVHSKTVAEDIVAEVFVNFWQNKVHENIQSSFKAYLYRSVQFRSFNALKKEFFNTVEDFDVHFKIPSYDHPDEILFYQDLINKLDRLITNLPPKSRKAFQMSRLDGRKYQQIATELNITTSAVEKLISRAITKIKSELL
jgi:RNA polymerase sigma-70 factor (family 1)